jgi:membrane fusion protein, multidrug efflux system
VGGGTPHPAVLVEDEAIGTDQDKKYVMVVDKDNRLQYREVTLGQTHEGLRVISKGLQPGERIVVNGLQRVRPNDVIKANNVAMAKERDADSNSPPRTQAQSTPAKSAS